MRGLNPRFHAAAARPYLRLHSGSFPIYLRRVNVILMGLTNLDNYDISCFLSIVLDNIPGGDL